MQHEVDELTLIARRHGTDKVGDHGYTPIYNQQFSKMRDDPITLLEIGIGGYTNPNLGGASLRMWKEYFPKATIIGLDIYDKTGLAEDRIHIYKGNQCDEALLRNIVLENGGVDIIVDDGSHINADVISTFETLFPLLNHRGIYVIEDTQTSYWPGYGGDSQDLSSPKFIIGYFKKLIDGLNYSEFNSGGTRPSYFDLHITTLSFYHNLIFVTKGDNRSVSNVPLDRRQP